MVKSLFRDLENVCFETFFCKTKFTTPYFNRICQFFTNFDKTVRFQGQGLKNCQTRTKCHSFVAEHLQTDQSRRIHRIQLSFLQAL
jgi:hypothetical protein